MKKLGIHIQYKLTASIDYRYDTTAWARTKSSAVAKKPRDASCLSVVSFNITYSAAFLLLVTAAWDLLVHKILLNSVLLSSIVSGSVRPKPPNKHP